MSDQGVKSRRSVVLLIAAIIGTICSVLLFGGMNNVLTTMDGMSGAETAGTAIGLTIVTPSIMVAAIGTILAWVGWGTRKRGFALAAGILYSVAIVLMIPYFMFYIIEMILSYVAYGTMKRA